MSAIANAALRGRLAAQLSAHRAMSVLGVDVSTKNIGLAVLRGDASLALSDVISADPNDDIYRLGQRVDDAVRRIHGGATPLAVTGVEDIMKKFSGQFHTQGLFKLARFNGIVSYICWSATSAPVELYMPNEIRAYFGLKGASPLPTASEEGGSNATSKSTSQSNASAAPPLATPVRQRKSSSAEAIKLAVMDFVGRQYPQLASSWELSRTGTYKVTNFDRADAVLTAMYTLAKYHENELLRQPQAFSEYCEDFLGTNVPAARKGSKVATLFHDCGPPELLLPLLVDYNQKVAGRPSDAEWSEEAVPTAKRKRKGSKQQGGAAHPPAPAGVDPEVLGRCYALIRQSFASSVQELLLVGRDADALWRAG